MRVAVAFFKFFKFVDTKSHCVFEENRCVGVWGRLISRRQRFIINVNRHLFKNMLKTKCTFNNGRLIQMRLASLLQIPQNLAELKSAISGSILQILP